MEGKGSIAVKQPADSISKQPWSGGAFQERLHQDLAFRKSSHLLFVMRSLQVVPVCAQKGNAYKPLGKAQAGCSSSAGLCPRLQHAPALVPLPGHPLPVIPVEELEVFIVWDVYLINLPGALVIWQILPFDQIMDVPLFIKARTHAA